MLLVDIKIKYVYAASLICGLMNAANAIVPILKHYMVQQIFRSSIFINQANINPFFDDFDDTGLGRVFRALFPNETETTSLYDQIDALRNLTSDPSFFDFTEISYYGNTPLCINNIFKNQDTYMDYKIAYILLLGCILTLVSISYILIVLESRKGQAIRQGPGPDQYTRLTIKVSLIIASQLLCWISLMVVTTYFAVTDSAANVTFFEVFAILIIPGNSFLNPILYSNLYSSGVAKLKKALVAVKELLPEIGTVDTPNVAATLGSEDMELSDLARRS